MQPTSVRAKFVVSKKNEETTGEDDATLAQVTLKAVDGAGNEDWSIYTPSGELNMTIRNKAAADQFVVGDNMYLTLTSQRVIDMHGNRQRAGDDQNCETVSDLVREVAIGAGAAGEVRGNGLDADEQAADTDTVAAE